MKIFKKAVIFINLFILLFALAGCSKKKPSEEYADKINQRFENNNPMTVKEANKIFGYVFDELYASSGTISWFIIDGATSKEKLRELVYSGATLSGIICGPGLDYDDNGNLKSKYLRNACYSEELDERYILQLKYYFESTKK